MRAAGLPNFQLCASCRRSEPLRASGPVRELTVGIALPTERIDIGTEAKRYLPANLRANTGYEVRVSFPATNPVLVNLWLEPASQPSKTRTFLRHRPRKLLNAEKIMFRTGPNGRIRVDNQEATGSVYIGFQAKPWAVYRSGKTPDALFYDIILEENVLGVPISSLPIILTAVGVLVVCFKVVPWWAQSIVPLLVTWLEGNGATGRRRGS